MSSTFSEDGKLLAYNLGRWPSPLLGQAHLGCSSVRFRVNSARCLTAACVRPMQRRLRLADHQAEEGGPGHGGGRGPGGHPGARQVLLHRLDARQQGPQTAARPPGCRALFCSLSQCCGSQLWGAPLQGFFYNRYAAPKERNGELGTETDANVNQQLFYHRVGTSQAEDAFLLAQPSDPEWMLSANVTDDGRCWDAPPPRLHAQKLDPVAVPVRMAGV